MNILVTGGSGFVGTHLLPELLARNHQVRASSLSNNHAADDVEWFVADLTNPDADLPSMVEGIDTVVHLAALAHRSEREGDAAGYWQLNLEGTRRLLDACKASGVKRFIYLSSIKALGEGSISGEEIYNENTVPGPCDVYGKSKRKAEQLVQTFCNDCGMEFVVLRPPLVYGPGVRANFLKLLDAVQGRTVLPLASITNRRSLLYVKNLCDMIVTCVESDRTLHDSFVVADHDASTPDLIREIGKHMQVAPRLWPFPVIMLKGLATLAGRAGIYQRLAGSLVIDSRRFRETFDWSPRYDFSQAIAETVDWYNNTHSAKASG
jgi:UDP-glucose 4-epimerase